MAEILGVVASGIAVTQLADQFVRSMNNLHTFWRDVKDAPQSIANILEELEILGLLLRQSLGQHCPPQNEDSAILRCLEYCKKMSGDLESIVEKLKPDPDAKAGRRRWNNIKGAFKKGEIQDIQSRLDRAKEMLNLAISSCSLSIQSEIKQTIVLLQFNQSTNEESTISQVETHRFLASNSKVPTSRMQRLRKSTRTYKPWWLPGYLQYEAITSPAEWHYNDQESNESCNRRTQWKLVPASWLNLRHLSIELGGSSWKYSFKVARTVPEDSEIFFACWGGDVKRMITLFNSGLATINDVLPDGQTLLHFAALLNNHSMCDWLITQGVDCTAVDKHNYTPLHKLASFPPPNVEQLLNCARILVEKGQIGPMFQDYRGDICLTSFSGHNTFAEYLIYSQEHFSMDDSQIHNKTLLQLFGASNNPYTPLIIRRLLGSREISFDFATEVWDSGFNSFLAGSVSRLWLIYHFYGVVVKELEFISELIKSGADIHFRVRGGYTLWDVLLEYDGSSAEINKECLIVSWLRCLHEGGVNLAEYFRKEEELHEEGKLVFRYCRRKSINRVFTIYYGQRSDDVTVLVEDIWNNKEHSSCPGAWDEELEDAEAHHSEVLYGRELSAFWSVTTSGFQDGDYSAVRASCDPGLHKRPREEDGCVEGLPDLECIY